MNPTATRHAEERREQLLEVLHGNPDDTFYASDFSFGIFDEVTTDTIMHDLQQLAREHEEVHFNRIKGFTPQLEWYWK